MLAVKLVPRGLRPTAAEDQAVKVLTSGLAPEAEHITRILLHFDEGVEVEARTVIVCHAKVTFAKALHVPTFHLEGRADTMRGAADLVTDAITGTVRRALEASKGRRATGRLAEQPPAPKSIELRSDREAAPPKSAHPPRGRHFHMTRHQAQATSAREASAKERPSRKSTRKSANRAKRDVNPVTRTGRPVRPVRPEARR